MLHIIFVLLALFCSSVLLTPDVVAVRHLVGEPDYRAVRLHWEVYTRIAAGGRALQMPPFHVRYCELQTWGAQRCRTHDVTEPTINELPVEDDVRVYSADVEGLRMATTYSFEVRPATARREDRADDNANDNVIVIPTKGFSARATQCLPHASEIEVSTGPHFAGRITVEASDGDRCTVDGEPESPRDTYVLHIDHKKCGSQVNETTVATYVIVQENLPILTHSTRRFLVLCSYQPETLTVRAGLSLPTGHSHHGHGHGQSAAVPTDQEYNSVRRSRQLRPAKLEAAPVQDLQNNEDQVGPLALILVLTVIGICCIAVVTFRWRRKKLSTEIDSVSIGSDISISTDCEDTISQAESSSTESHTNPLYFERNFEIRTEIPNSKTETVC